MSNAVAKIQARKVQSNHRMAALPRAFPNVFMHVENSVFRIADKFCAKYRGGFWEFFRLDNGGFFMALNDEPVEWCNAANQNSGEMSGEAFGIAVCMYVYANLSCLYDSKGLDQWAELMAGHYENLREFALDHPEAVEIFALND